MTEIMGQRRNGRKRFGYMITLIGGACWGFSGCCGQFLFEQRGATAEWLVALRLLFAGIILVGIGFLTEGKANIRVFKNRKDTSRLLVFTFAGVLLSQYTYFAAIQHSNAGTATILQYLFPVIVLFLVCFQEMRGPDGIEILAIILSLAGTAVLGTHGNFRTLQITPAALFFRFGSSCCGSIL